MTNFIRRTYRGLARACLVALLFTLAGVSAANAASENISKINICDYGYQDLPRLEAKFRDAILGKEMSDLTSFFQNKPYMGPTASRIDPRIEEYTGLPSGTKHGIGFRCPISHGNANGWALLVLADETGKATVLQLFLQYVGKDFSARDEPPTPHRFDTSERLADAVDTWGRKNSLTRDALKAEFLSAGFLFNRSCKSDDKLSDVYVTPFAPPDSATALLEGYFYLASPTSVVAVFSADDGKFLHAIVGSGEGSGECNLSESIHEEQFVNWLETDYPESWLTIWVKRLKAEAVERAAE